MREIYWSVFKKLCREKRKTTGFRGTAKSLIAIPQEV